MLDSASSCSLKNELEVDSSEDDDKLADVWASSAGEASATAADGPGKAAVAAPSSAPGLALTACSAIIDAKRPPSLAISSAGGPCR